jgi:hypothetical protein
MIPANLMHPTLVTDRRVPPGLSETVKATLWQKHGDHPAVVKVDPPIPLADANEVVVVKDGKVELYKGKPAVEVPKHSFRDPDNALKTVKVTPPDGTKFFQIRMVDAMIRREDPATGLLSDYLVMPGFYVIENDSDGVVWALSPHHVKAWFMLIED